MLSTLRLRNVATVLDAMVELAPGLNVLTGETGAGKSVLIDGLLLALGERADHSIVRPGERTASVEALFRTDGGEIVVRREINAGGRSRMLIDDEVADLETARMLTAQLVELHTQRSTPALLQRRTQQSALDGRAGCLDAARDLRETFRRLGETDARLAEIASALGAGRVRREMLEHEAGLLSELSPSRDEYVSLMERRRELERLRDSLLAVTGTVDALEGEGGAASVLRSCCSSLERAGHAEIAAMLRESELAAREACAMCSRILARVDGLGPDLESVDARLDGYGRLLPRYGGDIERMMSRFEALSSELESIDALEAEASRLEEGRPALLEGLRRLAARMGAARAAAVPAFEAEVAGELARLGMEGAEFRVLLTPPPGDRSVDAGGLRVCPDGSEVPEFAFSANPGMPPGPLATVPSGGELSRLALAVRLATARIDSATMIFDEIDAGVGGETASLLAESLARASRGRQLLVVTHLPQVASRADRHFSVSKELGEDSAVTRVRMLEGEERAGELARMLGGGGAALEHARSILSGGGR